MRICLIARNRFHGDRKALVTYRRLQQAGHEVQVVAVDGAPATRPVTATVSKKSGPANRLRSLVDRLVPERSAVNMLQRRLTAAAAATGAGLFIPLHDDVLHAAAAAARRIGGVVQRTPGMEHAGEVDLIDLAPAHPDLAPPLGGTGSDFTSPGPKPLPEPSPGRYQGEQAVLCYRKTGANPGRYIESALERSGFDVRVETDAIDLDTVASSTRFAIFVESPYPAITVTGSTSVPTLFWAHHGEHHLHANLRLADRYRADAVLLAHSWHLAHWFPAPVHRFPFAVAPELSNHPPRRLEDRSFDIAMVGSKLHDGAWQYRRRRQLVEALEAHLPEDKVRFVEGISPKEMAGLYENSKIVLNEGGVRHFPITMRVFEAIGAGAALLTDPIPGLEMLFDPGAEYAILDDEVVRQVEAMTDEVETTQTVADRAFERAMGHHTYDHRVDQLVRIADETAKREVPATSTTSRIGRLIDGDVEVQRIVHDSSGGLAEELADREAWPLEEREDRLDPASMDAALITSGSAQEKERLLDAARRYIYATTDVTGIGEYLRTHHPDAVTERNGDMMRIDLMAEAYRVGPAESTR